ncbi:hypothetical protein AHAS_Ahas17G0207900 [Arachis hypogaea]
MTANFCPLSHADYSLLRDPCGYVDPDQLCAGGEGGLLPPVDQAVHVAGPHQRYLSVRRPDHTDASAGRCPVATGRRVAAPTAP